MDQRLLAGLVCPTCLGSLRYDADKQLLICEHDRVAYPIRDNIPVLLENEALDYPPPQESDPCYSAS